MATDEAGEPGRDDETGCRETGEQTEYISSLDGFSVILPDGRQISAREYVDNQEQYNREIAAQLRRAACQKQPGGAYNEADHVPGKGSS